jgi:hypothetical protein
MLRFPLKLIVVFVFAFLVSAVSTSAQSCTESTQTDICVSLVPNSNVLPALPEAVQLRNNEQLIFQISNVSPLETCKLTSTSFASSPPASATQAAVTAIMGIAPFGIGGSLKQSLDVDHDFIAAKTAARRANPITEPLELAIQIQSTVIRNAQILIALQSGKQQDGNAIAAMYSAFLVTDYRTAGSFAPAYSALSNALKTNLSFYPPGEFAGQLADEYRRVTPGSAGGLLNDLVPTDDPNARDSNGQQIYIVELQANLDKAKSLVGQAHTIYDKDPAKLAQYKDDFVTSDRLQSNANQLLALIATNDTALRTQQTSLATLKVNFDQLGKVAFDNGNPKESIDLAVPRAKSGTLTGSITCLNRLDNTKVTLDTMPYSVTYQKVPLIGFSTGILFSPIPKQIFGTETVKDTSTTPPVTTPPTPIGTFSQVALTDSASAQVVPFSFLSLRVLPGWSYRKPANAGNSLYNTHPRIARFLSKRVFTGGLTGGFGVNPNSGTADPEYFAGIFGSVDRLMFHAGWDRGRIQTLNGQFKLGDVVPDGTTIPTSHHFIGKFAGAISVRLYP